MGWMQEKRAIQSPLSALSRLQYYLQYRAGRRRQRQQGSTGRMWPGTLQRQAVSMRQSSESGPGSQSLY